MSSSARASPPVTVISVASRLVDKPAASTPGEHCHRLPGLGDELHLVRDTHLAATAPIDRPELRQVALPVDQRVTARGGMGQERAELAVLRAARGARELPLHSGRADTLLQKALVIDDQHASAVTETLDHLGAQVVPARAPPQRLRPLRRPRPPAQPASTRSSDPNLRPTPARHSHDPARGSERANLPETRACTRSYPPTTRSTTTHSTIRHGATHSPNCRCGTNGRDH
jgi:hypothetical protein